MKNEYQCPITSLDVESFKRVPRRYPDEENELECFIDFLKGLFILDPQHRWNAKMALKHPFITREKFNNKFMLYKQDMSNINTSIDKSMYSDMNYSGNYSLACDYNQNDYLNQSCGSFHDQNFSQKPDYEPIDLSKFNAKILRNPVPHAKLLQTTNPKPIKNKYDNPNKSFMMCSFEKLSVNNSFSNEQKPFFYVKKARKSKKKKSTKTAVKSKFDAKNINFLTPINHKVISQNELICII